MPDMGEITAAIQAIKTALEIAKFLKDADLRMEKAEQKLKIVDLIATLADARASLAEFQDLVMEKDRQIEDLTQRIKTKGDLIRDDEAYYAKSENGDPIGDPYCARCFETEGIAVHLATMPDNRIRCFCPACKTEYWRAACRPIENSRQSPAGQ
jgi:hypothetical protein